MEQEEYRAAMIAARPEKWATIVLGHADWAKGGYDTWKFTEWEPDMHRVGRQTQRDLVEGRITHVQIEVMGAGDEWDGTYTGEVVDFDPYRGEFYVEFS